MRFTFLVLALTLTLAACSSSRSSSSPTAAPKGTYQGGLIYHIPTATPGKGGRVGIPTANPRTPLPTLRPVKTATLIAPPHFPASSYTASVYGTVTDAKTHKPLPGAIVQVADGKRTTRTNASGQYRVAFPTGGAGSIQVRKQGYQCGLAMGMLKGRQSVKKDWQCQRLNPKHPVPPPFPSFIGTPAPGMQVPASPPGQGAPTK